MERLIKHSSGGRHAPTEPSSPRKDRRGVRTQFLRASNQIAPDSYLGDILRRGKNLPRKRHTHRDPDNSDGSEEESSDSDFSGSDSDSDSSDSSSSFDSESDSMRNGRHHRHRKKRTIKYKPLTPTLPDKYGGESDPLKFYRYVTQCERFCHEARIPKGDQVAKCVRTHLIHIFFISVFLSFLSFSCFTSIITHAVYIRYPFLFLMLL